MYTNPGNMQLPEVTSYFELRFTICSHYWRRIAIRIRGIYYPQHFVLTSCVMYYFLRSCAYEN